jgi:hypothetical protein
LYKSNAHFLKETAVQEMPVRVKKKKPGIIYLSSIPEVRFSTLLSFNQGSLFSLLYTVPRICMVFFSAWIVCFIDTYNLIITILILSTTKKTNTLQMSLKRFLDPQLSNANPGQTVQTNADPDPIPDSDPNPGFKSRLIFPER